MSPLIRHEMRACLIVALWTMSIGCVGAPQVPIRSQQVIELEAAEAAYARNPSNEMTAVWLGRRLGYVGRYEDAVAAFTRGLELHPDSAWLLRFRGHRFITLRRFDDAVRDLERARDIAALQPDEIEPDGAPNQAGVPIGTLRSNIDYHLGLAHYLRGDFKAAWRAYVSGFDTARQNPDRLVSHTYWAWLTLKHLEMDEQAANLLAAIDPQVTVIENESYLALLQLFRGERSEDAVFTDSTAGKNDFATRGFGAGMKRLFDGDRAGACAWFDRVIAAGPRASFGCIAAEAELARALSSKRDKGVTDAR